MNKSALNQGQINTVNLGRQKFFQPLEHLSFLQKVSQDYISGKIQVFSISQQWSIYFEEGKLIYACQLNGMWDVFYKKLQQLNPEFINLNGLNGEVSNQLKAIFDGTHDDFSCSSYLAICWLLDQQYLSTSQVTQLIEELALEVMDSFLKLRDGIYEFLPESFLDDLPKFTHIDIATIARLCQQRARNMGNFIHPVYRSGSYLFSDTKEPDININRTQSPNQLKQGPVKVYQQESAVKVKVPIKRVNGYIDTLAAKPVKEATTINTQYQAPVTDTSIKSNIIGQYKVICIDDSPTIIKAIRGFLDEELFEVIGISDSLKALMQILRIKPDIILLDISMPNLDGYELCSLLRKHPEFRNIPVIMVTGRTGFIDKARAKLVKSSGYLTKPFTQAELIKTVFQQIGYIK